MQSTEEIKRITKRFRIMSRDHEEHIIMNYLDGISNANSIDSKLKKEAEDLQQLLNELRDLPMQEPDDSADERIQQLMERSTSKRSINIKKLWPLIAVAASIVFVFFSLNWGKSYESRYNEFQTNPEKLAFIYELNNSDLDADDIDWLKREMKADISPNIKVTIVDLLTNYQSKLDKEFFANLNTESIPTVQMALLNSVETSTHIDFTEELIVISERQDLEETVQQKIEQIILKQ